MGVSFYLKKYFLFIVYLAWIKQLKSIDKVSSNINFNVIILILYFILKCILLAWIVICVFVQNTLFYNKLLLLNTFNKYTIYAYIFSSQNNIMYVCKLYCTLVNYK